MMQVGGETAARHNRHRRVHAHAPPQTSTSDPLLTGTADKTSREDQHGQIQPKPAQHKPLPAERIRQTGLIPH
jgi:hypothetical protein